MLDAISYQKVKCILCDKDVYKTRFHYVPACHDCERTAGFLFEALDWWFEEAYCNDNEVIGKTYTRKALQELAVDFMSTVEYTGSRVYFLDSDVRKVFRWVYGAPKHVVCNCRKFMPLDEVDSNNDCEDCRELRAEGVNLP